MPCAGGGADAFFALPSRRLWFSEERGGGFAVRLCMCMHVCVCECVNVCTCVRTRAGVTCACVCRALSALLALNVTHPRPPITREPRGKLCTRGARGDRSPHSATPLGCPRGSGSCPCRCHRGGRALRVGPGAAPALPRGGGAVPGSPNPQPPSPRLRPPRLPCAGPRGRVSPRSELQIDPGAERSGAPAGPSGAPVYCAAAPGEPVTHVGGGGLRAGSMPRGAPQSRTSASPPPPLVRPGPRDFNPGGGNHSKPGWGPQPRAHVSVS